MKTKGALLWGVDQDWQIEEIELGDPHHGEVQVRLAASGLCHSDDHYRTGDMSMVAPGGFPVLGGHEGAGMVTKLGAGVTAVSEGDHVVLSFVPVCGRCEMCSTGHQNLCDLGAGLLTGRSISDGTFRIQARGRDATANCLLGTFSPYVTVHESSLVRIDDHIPLVEAALVGCGVTTGWGSATNAADVRPGETVVVIGAGGIGSNAVQGARMVGAHQIVAIDPVAFKRDNARALGATHAFASMAGAIDPLTELTKGRMAHKAILTVGVIDRVQIAEMMALIGKNGTGVVTAVANENAMAVDLRLLEFTMSQKRLQGSLFGNCNPLVDIPKILQLYQAGYLKLGELITKTYKLEEINEGYADMMAGRTIRGVVTYDDADY